MQGHRAFQSVGAFGIKSLFHGRRNVGLTIGRFDPVHALGQRGVRPGAQAYHLKAAVPAHGRARAQQELFHRQLTARGHQPDAIARAAAARRGHQLRQGVADERAFAFVYFRHGRPQFF